MTATDADVPADTVTFSIAGTGADDGAFTITSAARKMSLLFFVEIDESTESLNGGGVSIRQEIEDYRAFRASNAYKRFESVFGASFTGFRLLFIADKTSRATAISRLAAAANISSWAKSRT